MIMEAVQSGTPVLASHIPGNVGMVGTDYDGYFPPDDPAALVQRLREVRAGQQSPGGGVLARLHAQCQLRAPLFEPEAEQRALIDSLADLL